MINLRIEHKVTDFEGWERYLTAILLTGRDREPVITAYTSQQMIRIM